MVKRARRKIVKVDDVQRTLEIFPGNQSTGTGRVITHIPDMLQRVNRRQYQQARCYQFRIKGATTLTDAARNYEIYTLSNAWWVKKSIEFAKAVWLHSTKEERALLGDRKGKWNDFVISMDTGATSDYSDVYQYETGSDGAMTASEVSADETLYETQQSGSSVEGDQDLGAEYSYGFSINATDVQGSERAYNIFDQYLLTRQHVTPADTRDAPYKDLMDVDSVAMDNLKRDGDNAPFNLDAFPPPLVKQEVITYDADGSGDNKFSGFINAPLGIVIIKKTGSNGSNVDWVAGESLLLDVKSGRYKGVHAPAYKATKLLLESSSVNKFKQ